MILHGNSRSGGRNLAIHLMRTDENEHVIVHAIDGFMADDIHGAFQEIEAMAAGTRCQKPFFSLSLSPPKRADVSDEEFEAAISKAEIALGLSGQPKVIVFHEKGLHRDRHCHVVFSRINTEDMKAIPLPFNRMKMRDVSRELFIKHNHEVPRGLIDREQRDPLNYTFEEHQRAKRLGRDARSIKADIQNAWAGSDNRSSLEHALQEKGFRLARGDRRGFVVTDHMGEVYNLPKALGLKTRQVRERLGAPKELPELVDVQASFARDMSRKMDGFAAELQAKNKQRMEERSRQRQVLVERQRVERQTRLEQMAQRQTEEALARQSRYGTGLKGIWDWVRGENARIRKENEADVAVAKARNQKEKEDFILRQRQERQFFIERQTEQRERLITHMREVFQQRAEFEARATPLSEEDRKRAFKERRRAAQKPPRGPTHDR